MSCCPARCSSTSGPIEPKLRTAMAVCDRDNPDGVIADDVGDVMWKRMQIAASVSFRSQTRRLRIFLYPADRFDDLRMEAPPKSCFLRFVTRLVIRQADDQSPQRLPRTVGSSPTPHRYP